MNPKRKRILGILFGVILLYGGYGLLASQIQQMGYRESFSQLQHPQDTSLVDSLFLKIDYYPATYIDDSINFKSAHFVGELRSYTGDWEDINAFYETKTVEDEAPVVVMPVEVRRNDQQIWLDITSGAVFSPFVADLQSAINDHYRFGGILKKLTETESNLYLVYSVW